MYRAFLGALQSLNYNVEARVLNAADYGDPTSRRRLFIMARHDGRPISWPEPTHGMKLPYRTAREIIDWDIPGASIFRRRKALAPKTLARIAAGLRKYGGENAEPFLVKMYGTNDACSVDRPCPTITARGNHIGLCQPFLIRYQGDHAGENDGAQRSHSLDLPLPVVDTSNRYGLVEPFIIHTNHNGGDRGHCIDSPLPTITCGHRGEMALIQPFVIGQQSKSAPRTVDEPLMTIATRGAIALVEPFLTKYYGTAKTQGTNEPLDTITTRDRFGLVEPSTDERGVLDIRFRMLQPHELAAAMSFGRGYKFEGNKTETIKQIGNAVPVCTATALCSSLLLK
jgi:DNA (cytosine-5)-methyltransferase 1